MKLSQKMLSTLGEGVYSDDKTKNLRYRVQKGYRAFLYRRCVEGKSFEISLGNITLIKAQTEANRLNSLTKEEFVEERKQRQPIIEEADKFTFKRCVDDYFKWKVETGEWSTDSKNLRMYYNRLKNYAFPHIGNSTLSAIEPRHIATIAKGIAAKQITRDKVIRLIKCVFDWSMAQGRFKGSNPADRSGVLRFMISHGGKKAKKNFGALPIEKVPDFVARLYKNDSEGSFLFIFSILTATRSKTARTVKWEDIDFEKGIWNISASNLKKEENGALVIPLCPKVLKFLEDLSPSTGYIFTNRNDSLFSDNVFCSIMKKMYAKGEKWIDEVQTLNQGTDILATQHGIARACFRTWAVDDANGNDRLFDKDVAEMCLHHKLNDKYEGAYSRGKWWVRRQELMAAWADYCLSKIDLS